MPQTTTIDIDGVARTIFQARDGSTGLVRFSAFRIRPGRDGDLRYRWTDLANGLTCTDRVGPTVEIPQSPLGASSGGSTAPIISDLVRENACHLVPMSELERLAP